MTVRNDYGTLQVCENPYSEHYKVMRLKTPWTCLLVCYCQCESLMFGIP